MGVDVQKPFPDPPHQFPEAGVAGQVRPQGLEVDQEAEQGQQFRPVPVGDWDAEDDVVLPGVPGEQDVEGGRQHREQADLFPAAQAMEAFRDVLAEGVCPFFSLVSKPLGPRPPDRPFERGRRTAEVVRPEREFRGICPLLDMTLLPGGEVRVVEGHRIQVERLAPARGPVSRRQLVVQDRERPPIANHVMQGEDEDMVLRPATHKGGANPRSDGQVKPPPRLVR